MFKSKAIRMLLVVFIALGALLLITSCQQDGYGGYSTRNVYSPVEPVKIENDSSYDIYLVECDKISNHSPNSGESISCISGMFFELKNEKEQAISIELTNKEDGVELKTNKLESDDNIPFQIGFNRNIYKEESVRVSLDIKNLDTGISEKTVLEVNGLDSILLD